MAVRPDTLPKWAMALTNETVVINGTLQNIANRVPITNDFENTGVLYKQPLPQGYLNQWMYLTSAFVQHLDERYRIGDWHMAESAEDAAAISTRLGGTWEYVGTLTVGTSTANVWRKIA